jgi:septal ring factor EnvC (AmiA/AmiB activator)
MAKKSTKPDRAVERLIEERQRLEQWLERLDSAADDTPQHVRDRVRGDYESRLADVLQELQGYRDEMAASLERQETARDDLAEREAQESERLTEAELRHAVGEYDEKDWTELRTEIQESLAKVREELKSAEAEIVNLRTVIASVERAPAVEPEPEPEAVTAVEVEEREEPRRGAQTDAFDEMAFLKSVAENEQTARQAEEPPPPSPSPPQAAAPEQEKTEKQPEKLSLGASGVRAVTPAGELPEVGVANKTVKCADCGTLNLPTEWYCESCGAELTSV